MSSDEDTMSETGNVLLPTSGRGGGIITPVQPSGASPESLQRVGLTSLQQLNRSGNILLESMQKSVNARGEEFNIMEVVECAKALATTVQTQSNLVKVLKEFIK